MIVVSGIGAVCALGSSVEAAWAALCRGESGVRDRFAGLPVARVDGGTGTSLARRAVAQALAEGVAPEGLAVVGASTCGDMSLGEAAYADQLRGTSDADPRDYLWTQLCDRPTRILANELGATGPVITVSTACTSGATAVAVARDLIRSGRARAALAFGTDALCRTTAAGFASLGLHSATGCRPFDVDRDGMCLGEGAAAILLRRAEDARSPLATLLGAGNSQDAHHLSTPEPTGAGAIRAVRAALAEAGVDPDDVGYVNAHGTGTVLNDAMEETALAAVVPGAPVSSTKGATGHTLGAAGTLEAVFAVLALRDGVLPANVGLSRTSSPLDFVRTARAARPTVAMSVNFAFGGHNTALVFGR